MRSTVVAIMIKKLFTSAILGLKAFKVEVETLVVAGLPQCLIVGLPNAEIKEAKERVFAAIKASGIDYPMKRKIVNLAPADLPKSGTGMDLCIALGLIIAGKTIDKKSLLLKRDLEKTLFIGELALDGSLRGVAGVLSSVKMAKEQGFEEVVLPLENLEEACLVNGINIFGAGSLNDVINCNFSVFEWSGLKSGDLPFDVDFDEISGNWMGKRALEVAIAGGHNICFTGPPGSGKSMLAKASASVAPTLTQEEVLEVAEIYSVYSKSKMSSYEKRQVRCIHPTASKIALIGGGVRGVPGEITLAHKGFLFLDELPEFSRSTLEALRQPLEDRKIVVSRANCRLEYPADFTLIASMNPCPCGYFNSGVRDCTCSHRDIQSYKKRISGPLRDRIDIWVEIGYSGFEKKSEEKRGERVETDGSRIRVKNAREKQLERFKTSLIINGSMKQSDISKFCKISEEGSAILEKAVLSAGHSPRAHFRILKVARTIADLDKSNDIKVNHLLEALQYRGL